MIIFRRRALRGEHRGPQRGHAVPEGLPARAVDTPGRCRTPGRVGRGGGDLWLVGYNWLSWGCTLRRAQIPFENMIFVNF